MPIRQTISASGETIISIESSADEKYKAGFELLAAGYFGTGVELMGLAAEMLLKAAYFRFVGVTGTAPLNYSQLHAAKLDAISLDVLAQPEQYHSLEFWAELILKRRLKDGKGLTIAHEAALNAAVQTLTDNYWIGMRYQSLQGKHVPIQDLDDVFDAISWLIDNQASLWR